MLRNPNLDLPFFITLLSGAALGFTMAYIIISPNCKFRPSLRDLGPPLDDYHRHFQYEAGPSIDPGSHGHEEEFHALENSTVADYLYKKVRVLCWVMTGPDGHETRAKHVKATWGKRCNKLLFMSSQKDDSLPTISLPVDEGRDNLWAKTKEAFKYIYQNHFEEADWFLKADDDTYVVVENLRYMLASYKTSDPMWLGCKFKAIVKQGYMSGGAGYVLSKEAVRRFIEISLNNSTICHDGNGGAEDAELGKCLENVNVMAGDSRDSLERERFFPFVPESHLIPGILKDQVPWFLDYIYYPPKEGLECCSDNAISFHYVSPNYMYVLEYLLYHLRPYGITYTAKMPSEPTNTEHNENLLSKKTKGNL